MRTLFLFCTLSLLCIGLPWGAFTPSTLSAQIGLHPPEVDWRKLTTDEGNIMYPAGYEARAQRIANLIAAMRSDHAGTVGEKHTRFDLVLQTPNTNINGYVGLAPFRSEFYLTPPQQPNLLSNTDWADLLAIHEFRHVQQVSNERRGLTKLWSYLFGQPGWAFGGGIATPNWYAEGDAVIMETALTAAGRGRTPAFSAGMRALLDEDIIYSYARSRNNSFKRYIPDHYRYGYNTITYAREAYGEDVWTDVLHRGAAWSGLFYAFSNRLRAKTGLGTRKMYRAAAIDLGLRQNEDLRERGALVEGRPIGRDRRAVTDYRYPTVDEFGRVLALRAGYQHVPQLVEIDAVSGGERVIASIGIQREPYVDVNGEWAAWMENRNDPRYTNQGYSDVFLHNLKTGEKRRLSYRQKYFSPSPGFGGDRVVAVREDLMGGILELVILSAIDGAVIKAIPLAANSAALPKFSPDGETIYYYEKTFDGTAIVAIGADGTGRRVLKPASYEPLGNLRVTPGGMLVYGSGRDGVDNAYQLDPASGQSVQLTNVAIGAEDPYISGSGDLYYTEATPRGLRLRQLELSGVKSESGAYPGIPGGKLMARSNVMTRPNALQNELFDLTQEVASTEYPTEDVSDNLSGMRLHSWSLVGNAVAPGIGIQASNALNTASVSLAGRYNINEERPTVSFTGLYGGLYPVIGASLSFSERNFLTSEVDDNIEISRTTINQVVTALGASIPYSWTAGQYFLGLQPSASLSGIILQGENRRNLPNSFLSTSSGLTAQALRTRGRQQVHSRLGVTASINFDRVLSSDNLGQRFLVNTRLWLPGIGRTHGIRLDFAYQSEDLRRPYQYIDAFQYARGYDIDFVDNAYRFSANYELPLAHPDWGLLGIWYLKRIRLNAFYDHGGYNLSIIDQDMRSAGAEFYFDQTWFNTADGSFGIQFARLLTSDFQGNDSGDTNVQIVIGQRF